jgi:hypothetical protein
MATCAWVLLSSGCQEPNDLTLPPGVIPNRSNLIISDSVPPSGDAMITTYATLRVANQAGQRTLTLRQVIGDYYHDVFVHWDKGESGASSVTHFWAYGWDYEGPSASCHDAECAGVQIDETARLVSLTDVTLSGATGEASTLDGTVGW